METLHRMLSGVLVTELHIYGMCDVPCRHQLEQQAAELAKEVTRLKAAAEQEVFLTENTGAPSSAQLQQQAYSKPTADGTHDMLHVGGLSAAVRLGPC
jgi:hypothetical protein